MGDYPRDEVIRVRQEGTCRVCGIECTREPGGRWYNFYGRDECKLAPDDGMPHIVPEWTERVLPPERVPACAEVILTIRQADGTVTTMGNRVPEGTAWSETFSELVTVVGWDVITHAAKMAQS